MNGVHNKDNEKQIRMLSDLMQLYSVSSQLLQSVKETFLNIEILYLGGNRALQ